MAIIYCDSAGSNTAPYDSWATAATTLQTALTAWTSGDIIYVKYDSQVDSAAGSEVLTGGTIAGRIPIYTVNSSGIYTKASIANPNIDLKPSSGLYLKIQASGNYKGLAIKPNKQLYIDAGVNSYTLEDISVEFEYSSVSFIQLCGSNGDAAVELINPTITEDAATHAGLTITFRGVGKITGGSLSVHTKSNGLFGLYSNRVARGEVSNFDMSGSTFTGPLVDMSTAADTTSKLKFINCELPAGVTVSDGVFGNDLQAIELISTGSSDTAPYNYEKHVYRAILTTDTGTYLNGGFTAPDGSGGDQNLSHAITPNSVFKDGARFEGPWLYKMNTVTGSAQTVTIYSADDFTTSPNANQAYIEVVSMSTSGEVLGTLATSRPADLLATTAMDADSSTWAGSPAHTHKMTCSFTAQEEGVVAVRVVLEGQDLSGETANSFFYDPEVNIA